MKERSSPVCTGPSTNQPLLSGLTFEQFVDVMVLCAVAAFGVAPAGNKPHVVFDGEASLLAKALWTNHSEVRTQYTRLLLLDTGSSMEG